MKSNSLKKLLLGSTLLALTGSTVAFVSPAMAQEATASSPEVIVITGTRIQREGYTSASPVETVTAEDLEKTQPTDVQDVLRQMPQFQPGLGGNVNNGSAGVSTVDLRGLNAVRTLPLIDGHRMVGFDPNGVFDTSVIPLALLKRVDVVTGGASAVYGSDAVAGVVNFILNDNFQGVQVDGQYGIDQHGSGETENYQLTTGASFDNGRGNVVLSMGYLNREAVAQTIAPASSLRAASGFSPNADFLTTNGTYQVDNTGNLATPQSIFFNFNPSNLYQTPDTRRSATALAKYKLTDHIEAYERFIFSDSHVQFSLAATPLSSNVVDINLDNPFLVGGPTGANATILRNGAPSLGAAGPNPHPCAAVATSTCVTIPINYRTVPLGPRLGIFDNETYQQLAGLRGDFDLLGSNWKWDISGAHGETSFTRQQKNDVNLDNLKQALVATNTTTCADNSGGCVPFNILNPSLGNSPAALDFLRLNLQVHSVTKQDYVTGSVSGDLGKVKSPLANSPIGIALGTEYRDESSDFEPDFASQQGISPGFGPTLPISGRYDVFEQFVEALIPVVEDKPFIKSINIETGYRNSNYDTSGVAHTYKYGADYSPIQGLRFRAMFDHAIRAPNIAELFSPVVAGTGDASADPCALSATAPAPSAALRSLCLATGVPATVFDNRTVQGPVAGQVSNNSGGNGQLQPERANTWTVGAVFQPEFIPGLGITLDYYDIKIKDAIGVEPIDAILSQCYSPTFNATLSASAPACALIHRNLTGSLTGDPGIGVTQLNDNIASLLSKGIDYSIRYQYMLPGSWGSLEASLQGTHTNNLSYVPFSGAARIECAGFYGKNCSPPSTLSVAAGGPTPKDRFVQRTTWTWGPLDVSYNWRYLAGTKLDIGGTGVGHSISDYNYLDLDAGWDVTKMLRLKASVTNIFDKEAPLVPTGTGSTPFNSGNTYPSMYDVLGRVFTVGLTAKF